MTGDMEDDEDKMDAESTSRNPDDPFDMAHYDDEPDDAVLRQALSNVATGRDPYLKDGDLVNADEIDDVLIRRDDLVLLAACSEDDELSHLDVYVYERANDNLYVHHDYMLPAFPLSMAWLSFPVGSERADDTRRENLVAVSTFEPYIEIWDLDVYDQPTPLAVLGGPENPRDFGKKLTRKLLQSDSHSDAILGLAWNLLQRNLLASCSADGSVKVWDLCSGSCLLTLRHHGGAKVQCLQWNPVEPALIATGAYDKRVAVVDVRASETAVAFALLDADAEALLWLPFPRERLLLVATERGSVLAYDVVRGLSQPVWHLNAHSKPTQALAVSSAWQGTLLATGSADKHAPIKLWVLRDTDAPSLLWEGASELNAVYSLSFSPDEPFILIAGVQGDRPAVIDLLNVDPVKHRNSQWLASHSDSSANMSTSPVSPPDMAAGSLSEILNKARAPQVKGQAHHSSGQGSSKNSGKNKSKGKGKANGKGR